MRRPSLALAGPLAALLALGGASPTAAAEGAAARPNILFVILDDVGIDQMESFGFGGGAPADLPNMDAIAKAGIKFTNVWSMPECSPSRATYFTGRFPSRTGVEMAILDNHLPQAYVSPFETTLPRVLETAGYRSAMVGKYHLGEAKDPAGSCAPATRGFDAFFGNMTAGPPSIDRTAGGVDTSAAQACGYFQTDDAGACYTQSDAGIACTDITKPVRATSPSRTCLQRGGIFAPKLSCSDPRPEGIDFTKSNAYYVWPRTRIVGERSPFTAEACGTVTQSRGYMTSVQASDGATWWRAVEGPRMLTLSFNSIHTPFQKASTALVPDPLDRTSACNMLQPERFLLNSVLEGADTAIGQALAAMGLATLKADGRTIATLDLKNTLVVIVGDNGSFGPTVRLTSGFPAARTKGTVYQGGVWVPLIVAGGMVRAPGRDVDDMVNVADLFRLFADVAGVDADAAVPPSHRLDARSMLRYLKDPQAEPVRDVDYTELGVATFSEVEDERSWPCVLGNACSDTLFLTENFCKDNGGTWYGPGATTEYPSCCAVANANPDLGIVPNPIDQRAARTPTTKLVRSTRFACDQPLADGEAGVLPWATHKTVTRDEFYDIAKTKTNPKGIDKTDLLASCTAEDPASCLPARFRADYKRLAAEIDRVARGSSADAACRAKGDGNMDGRITRADLVGWNAFDGEGPSRYDVNVDGETDADDRAIIAANLGTDCISLCRRADLDRNGRLDEADYRAVIAQSGRCDPVTCSGDLTGDLTVDRADRVLFRKAEDQCAKDPAGFDAALAE